MNKINLQNIKVLRKLKGMTLPDLAKKAGVSKGFLSQLENGKAGNITLNTLSKVADTLGIKLHNLFVCLED